ncbi:MAG: hypothetical protein ACI8QS_000869 [Planctomycetota bacterium]|jgi:hypothetical protein
MLGVQTKTAVARIIGRTTRERIEDRGILQGKVWGQSPSQGLGFGLTFIEVGFSKGMKQGLMWHLGGTWRVWFAEWRIDVPLHAQLRSDTGIST